MSERMRIFMDSDLCSKTEILSIIAIEQYLSEKSIKNVDLAEAV